MREFGEFEQKVIRKIVIAREQSRIKDFSLSKILDDAIDSYAIELCDNPENPNLVIVHKSEGDGLQEMLKLLDVIILIKYLEDNGLLLFHRNPNTLKDNFLYNRKRFKREYDGDYWEIMENGSDQSGLQGRTTIKTDLAILVCRYARCLVHPSYELVDLVNNNFKTPDQRRFKKQQWATWVSIGIAFAVGIATIWISICK